MALRLDGTPALGLFDQQGCVIRLIEPTGEPEVTEAEKTPS
jgi:hypothetical protein